MSNTTPPPGTRHADSDVERRLVIAFSVAAEKLQPFLPAKWRAASLPPGPSEGANLLVAFRNRLQTTRHTTDGTNQVGEPDRGAVVTAVMKHTETDESGIWVVRVLLANPAALPGPYRNAELVSVQMDLRIDAQDNRGGVGIESWQLKDQDGRELSMSLRYGIGVPVRSVAESKVRGGPDPNFSRIYRADRGVDVVRSVPKSVDRVEDFKFHSTLPEFSGMFDGNEKLVSIAVEPWYVRQVFLYQ
jgi:hypothetical protein